MPLPLREPGDMPVVLRGSAFGAVELAAGSPVTAPRPLGAPPDCAEAPAVERTIRPAVINGTIFTANLQSCCAQPAPVSSVPIVAPSSFRGLLLDPHALVFFLAAFLPFAGFLTPMNSPEALLRLLALLLDALAGQLSKVVQPLGLLLTRRLF